MKTTTFMLGIGLVVLTGVTAAAGGMSSSFHFDSPSADWYRANEWSVDTFMGMTFGGDSTDPLTGSAARRDVRLGAGTGVNYFISRNFGVAVDGFSENTRHSFVDLASGSLVYRQPIGQSKWALYLLGGGGHQFDQSPVTTWHTGGGFEYRLNSHWSTFLEPRIVFQQSTGNFGFGRFGVRLNF